MDSYSKAFRPDEDEIKIPTGVRRVLVHVLGDVKL
jgi:hypothetical protein